MKKIEAIIRPSKLYYLIEKLEELGITGMNVFDVKGYGNQKGHDETYRGITYKVKLRKKTRIEIVIGDKLVEEVIKTIVEAAQTGEIGDGKIFISNIEDAVRIRTTERGDEAL